MKLQSETPISFASFSHFPAQAGAARGRKKARPGGSTIRWTQIPTILVSDHSATLVAEW